MKIHAAAMASPSDNRGIETSRWRPDVITSLLNYSSSRSRRSAGRTHILFDAAPDQPGGTFAFQRLRQPFLTPAIILARCSRMRSRLSSRAACPHLAKFGSHAFTRTFILMLNLNCESPFHQTRRRAFALRARSTSAPSQVVLEDRINDPHAILPTDFFAFRVRPAAAGKCRLRRSYSPCERVWQQFPDQQGNDFSHWRNSYRNVNVEYILSL